MDIKTNRSPETLGKLEVTFDAESFLATLTTKPGVYQMFDSSDAILYVGKAKNLRNRVKSYFRASGLQAKTMALVAKISRIEVNVTKSETEALLLEQSLIKKLRPPYNIILRDDKSYPLYIHFGSQKIPQLLFHRGKKNKWASIWTLPVCLVCAREHSLSSKIVSVAGLQRQLLQ